MIQAIFNAGVGQGMNPCCPMPRPQMCCPPPMPQPQMCCPPPMPQPQMCCPPPMPQPQMFCPPPPPPVFCPPPPPVFCPPPPPPPICVPVCCARQRMICDPCLGPRCITEYYQTMVRIQ
ncbi:unnamed protein product [Adineta steineri]|uniref:Uncharacterized protein n=1 Tax=Adineta steineri TaxID=433720 RepID=A0A814TJB1_9BILA|nr:unnamed protein product [Adineta steineri]CAF3990336.1 unnamed protein product [Adineta steineri]